MFIYYYPQCPWIILTIDSIVKASKKLGYQCDVHDLFSEDLNVIAIFKVRVNGKDAPLGIGITDVNDVTKHLLDVSVNIQEQESSENIASCPYGSKPKILWTLRIDPISFDNMNDEIDLCVGEDFIYGVMPRKFLKEAMKMKRRWLQHILAKFKVCGYIAYLKKRPIGFIEFVPGDLAQNLGIKTYYPPRDTAVILCLSVKRIYWGLKVGSKLLLKMVNYLSSIDCKYVEVNAYKSEIWHPLKFYLKNNFKITK